MSRPSPDTTLHAKLKVVPAAPPARIAQARALEHAGRYEEARDALGDMWRGVGEWPCVSPDSPAAAEALLCAAIISGRLASAAADSAAAARAKDLTSESLAAFEARGDVCHAAEALVELGHCYWREGAFDEARVILRDALGRMGTREPELRVLALTRLAVVEKSAKRYPEALRVLEECGALVDEVSPFLKGTFFNTRANVLKYVGKRDEALIAYAAAAGYFEEAGHERYCARVENNCAGLFRDLGKYEEAHACLDRARPLLVHLCDEGTVAQVDETRARILIAQRRYLDALRVLRPSVATLERGGEPALLAESLTTQGVALARAGLREQARASLTHAADVAEIAGDLEGAGLAAMTVIEELGEWTPLQETVRLYELAALWLKDAKDAKTAERLRACSLVTVGLLSRSLARVEPGQAPVHPFPRVQPRPGSETFTIYVPDDSLAGEGLARDAPVTFSLTGRWRDGDLVFAVTPDGNFIVFIFGEPDEQQVRLEGAHPECPVRRYRERQVIVFGVRV